MADHKSLFLRRALWWSNGGQTIVEAIVLLPIVIFLIFGLLQLGQLGLGILVANYGAGSAARKLSRTSVIVPDATMQAAYTGLLVAGMNPVNPGMGLSACENTTGGDVATSGGVTSDIIVVADAQISAFPIVGPMLNSLHPTWLTQSATWSLQQAACTPAPIPTISFTGPPAYEFIVRGSAMARRNYL